MSFLTAADLAPFTDASLDVLDIIIADLEAVAAQSAPCLADPAGLTVGQYRAVVAIVRSAALRWAAKQDGSERQLVAGPYSVGPSGGGQSLESRRPLLWPSEIDALQKVCAGSRRAVMGWLA